MFLMWGFEGEELEDIAATVEHVKLANPDILFTTVSYPIKGTQYFDDVRDKVELPLAWANASDRDYVIHGRRSRDYYRLADQWLRGEVAAHRLAASDPTAAAALSHEAALAREQMHAFTPKSADAAT
jgi:3',5'-cyclic AMP phosphodiesterase CpdA